MGAYLQKLEDEDTTTDRKVPKWYVVYDDNTFDGPFDTEEEALGVLANSDKK